jgi:pyruvate ferredoxin oxidoreductase beta subunit/2-oxoisovalerate ferredoxin oxidoreductase beta subunit
MTTTEIPLRYTKEEYIQPPHGFCVGCSIPIALRWFLKVTGEKVILLMPPGCASPSVLFPKPSLIHQGKRIKIVATPFGSAAIFAGGVKSALVARGDTETQVVAWAGDGATLDIGLAAVSAAAERNEDIIYVCYDNEAYQNTGNQRSSATPWGVRTTTNPLPKPKMEYKKDIMSIIIAHRIPYAATLSTAYPDDFMRKVQKAKRSSGFRFLHILTPCVTGWQFPLELGVKISRLAVQTKVFPLFEAEGDAITITKEPKGLPVEEYIRVQGRYRHLTKEQVDMIQNEVDKRWNQLQYLARYGSK